MNSDWSIEDLLHPSAYPHAVSDLHLVETHISWVLLTGEFAYKLKKPLDLGFLDFSTIERRRHFCEEELRLNRRFAATLYRDVVPLRRADGRVGFGVDGEIVDYAVKMRQFDESAVLLQTVRSDGLAPAEAERIGEQIAVLHTGLPTVRPRSADSPGGPAALLAAAEQNFEQAATCLSAADELRRLDRIRDWTLAAFERGRELMIGRADAGLVRECHGDLHLGNIVRIDDGYLPFDCIEFGARFRDLDIQADIAFLLMDLQRYGCGRAANLCYNAWLEHGGDYQGVALTRLYRCYFATTRAKVALLRDPRDDAYRPYLRCAEEQTREKQACLYLMHGPSGAGKSSVAKVLASLADAVVLRADVERKRLHGLGAEQSSEGTGSDIYSQQASDRTFAYLLRRADEILAAGESCVVDSTFLALARRQPFLTLAQERKAPLQIVSCEADSERLRQRVRDRLRQGGDPSEADLDVLESQLRNQEPLSEAESRHTLRISLDMADWKEFLATNLR